jgi:methylated-DNA-[protein]-cysteine S-methyltransferase
MPIASLNTIVGPLSVHEEAGAIVRLSWEATEAGAVSGAASGTGAGGEATGAEPDDTPLLREALNQLAAYFDHRLTSFDLPLQVAGSDFQRAVCDAMCAIPFGETRTYGDIARTLGRPAQPVGNACGANPIPVIIPCHRILGANGLGGFSGKGGVETKVTLLRHEGAASLLI